MSPAKSPPPPSSSDSGRESASTPVSDVAVATTSANDVSNENDGGGVSENDSPVVEEGGENAAASFTHQPPALPPRPANLPTRGDRGSNSGSNIQQQPYPPHIGASYARAARMTTGMCMHGFKYSTMSELRWCARVRTRVLSNHF